MTVSTINSVVTAYPNGVTTQFPVNYRFFNDEDLRVIYIAIDGSQSILDLNSDYSVSGAGSQNGGYIQTIGSPLDGGSLVIARVMTPDQLTDLRNQGGFFAEIHEDVFDRLTMLIQQALDANDRVLTRPITDSDTVTGEIPPVAARAGRLLGFDAQGNPVVSVLTTEQIEQQPALAIAAAAAASASASEAAGHAAAALGFASAADSSASDASNSAIKASQWAENPEDVPVEPGLFSAKHWAAKAAAALSGIVARVTSLENKALTRAIAQATTSGAAIDFTGIPSGIKRITVSLSLVSTSGTSNPILQLGSGSIDASGYSGSVWQGNTANAANTSGFLLNAATAAANNITMNITLVNITGNQWVASVTGSYSAGVSVAGGGAKTLSGTLDRIRLTTVGGTDSFDAGLINILWEG